VQAIQSKPIVLSAFDEGPFSQYNTVLLQYVLFQMRKK